MNSTFNFKKFLSIVLSILIVAQTASSGVYAFNTRDGIVHQTRGVTTTLEGAMLGFGGDISQFFLNDLGELVGVHMDMGGLVGFNGLMADGSISESALRGISRSLLSSRRGRDMSGLDQETKALVNMAEVVNKGHMTISALRSIKNMFDNDLISPLGLTRLASLYREYDISYVGMIEDTEEQENKEDENNEQDGLPDINEGIDDGIERIHAFTTFPGCEENDIIVDGVVWAACNSSAPGFQGFEMYSLTYDNQVEDTVDENGWEYGNLYYHHTIACPVGYRTMTTDDYHLIDGRRRGDVEVYNLLQMIRLPYGGVKISNGYYGQGAMGMYIVTDEGTNYGWYINPVRNYHLMRADENYAVSLRCVRTEAPTQDEWEVEEVDEIEEEEKYIRDAELRCEEDRRTISRYDSNEEKTSTKYTCNLGCNDEPRCLTSRDIAEAEYTANSELRCEGNQISRYDSNGEKTSMKDYCRRGCNDDPRCLVESEAEEEEDNQIDTELRCDDDGHTISRYNSNGARVSTRNTCTRGCNNEPRCLTQQERESEVEEEYIRDAELICEEDRRTISRYDSNGEKTSTKYGCSLGCNDEPRCLTQEDLEENDTETPTYDEYVNSKVEEINQCHIDLYNAQLEELNNTIDSFQSSVSEAHNRDNDTKALKYIKAISKLEQIRQTIADKYKSVFGIE